MNEESHASTIFQGINPVYSQAFPSKSIDIGSFSATISNYDDEHGSKPIETTINVVLAFSPNPTVKICAKDMPISLGQGNVETRIEIAECSSVVVSLHRWRNGNAEFIPKKGGFLWGNDEHDLSSIRFHLLNFPDLFLRRAPAFSFPNRDGDDEWQIRIQRLKNGEGDKRAIEDSGGYKITHAGEISLKSGKLFFWKEGRDELAQLKYFLSFLKGASADVFLPVGIDSESAVVVSESGSPFFLSQTFEPTSWFPFHLGSEISGLYQNFVRYLRDENWRETVEYAIYWLCNANDRKSGFGTESAILLTQAALEELYDAIFNLDSPVDGVRRIVARPKIRAWEAFNTLLDWLEVGKDIPDGLLPAFEAARNLKENFYLDNGEPKKRDVSSLFVAMRNGVIHAKKKLVLNDGRAYFDALYWSLWLIECVILKLCAYEGEYYDRRRIGTCKAFRGYKETVPWS